MLHRLHPLRPPWVKSIINWSRNYTYLVFGTGTPRTVHLHWCIPSIYLHPLHPRVAPNESTFVHIPTTYVLPIYLEFKSLRMHWKNCNEETMHCLLKSMYFEKNFWMMEAVPNYSFFKCCSSLWNSAPPPTPQLHICNKYFLKKKKFIDLQQKKKIIFDFISIWYILPIYFV